MLIVKKMTINGDIVDDDTAWMYNFFGMSCTSPKSVRDVLQDSDDDETTPEDLTVDISSGGGDVFAGSEIYTLLRNYAGKVVVNVYGMAASAASVIAMAGDEVNMSPTAQMMIHKAWSVNQGNADDHEHEAKVLDSIDQSIVNAYFDKTGLKRDDILQMMQNETWMTAQEAVDKGFANGIMFHNDDDDEDDTDDHEDALQVAAATHSIPKKDAVKKFMMLLHSDKAKETVKKQQNNSQNKPTSLYDKKLALLLNKNITEKEN